MSNTETQDVQEVPAGATTTETVEEPGGQEPQNGQKKRKPRLTFEKRMEVFRSAVQNAMDDESFRPAIAEFGFDTPRLTAGMEKLTNASAAEQEKKDKKAEFNALRRNATVLRKKAHKTLMKCISSTRLAYEEDVDKIEMLGLKGRIASPFGEWIAQGQRYYEKTLASEDIRADIAKYNVSQELLSQGRQELGEAVTANDLKMRAKGDAENATQLKHEAYTDALIWMRDFYRVVDMAFAKYPQLKEKVGIVVSQVKVRW